MTQRSVNGRYEKAGPWAIAEMLWPRDLRTEVVNFIDCTKYVNPPAIFSVTERPRNRITGVTRMGIDTYTN